MANNQARHLSPLQQAVASEDIDKQTYLSTVELMVPAVLQVWLVDDNIKWLK